MIVTIKQKNLLITFIDKNENIYKTIKTEILDLYMIKSILCVNDGIAIVNSGFSKDRYVLNADKEIVKVR